MLNKAVFPIAQENPVRPLLHPGQHIDLLTNLPLGQLPPTRLTTVDDLTAKRTDPDADVSTLENEMDQMVYSLYNLTPEEIAIVEEATE